MLYRSYIAIKEIAEKKHEVKVIRSGETKIISNTDLVPGDIYIPEENKEVPADCILLSGDIYVNEANLTGESYPIAKFHVNTL